MIIDLAELSTPTLKAIRRVLVDGATATASRYADADGTKRLKALAAENEQLKRLNERRKMLEDAEVAEVFDFNNDANYILSFSDDNFKTLIGKLVDQKVETQRELSLAERTKSIKVPNLIGSQLSAVDEVRAGFKALRNKRNGTGED